MLDLNYKPEVVVSTKDLSNEEWLEYRRKGIGGSDVSVIYGVNKWNTCRDLYFDKKGIKPMIPTEEDGWVAKEVGHLLEPLVAKIFYKKTGLQPYAVRKMFRHPLFPWMQADVDYFVDVKNEITGTNATWILECKTTNAHSVLDWGSDSNPRIPEYYRYQGRHYCAVMNVDGVFFACLSGNSESDFLYRAVPRNLVIEEAMIEEESCFWNQYVVKGIVPPLTESGRLRTRSIAKQYGNVVPGVISLSSPKSQSAVRALIALSEEKKEANAKVRKLEKEMEYQRASLLEEMKGYRKASISFGEETYLAGYKVTERNSVPAKNLPLMQAVYPEVYEKFVETTTSEKLEVKKKEGKT